MRILVSTRLPDPVIADMKKRFAKHDLIFDKAAGATEELLETIDVMVSGGRTFPDEFYEHAKKLKLIQVPWIGTNNFEWEKLQKHGIKVANSKWNTLLVAEFTLGLLMSGLKQITRADRVFRAGKWESRGYSSTLLSYSKVLLLGFGDIGTHFARLLQPFQCEITAIKNNLDNMIDEQRKLVRRVIGWDEYEAYAKEADIVVVTLPLTEKTEGILSKERLFMIKKGAYLVNIGRGAVVNEQGLYEAVKDHLAGAAIDVWYLYKRDEEEPFYPSKYPIHELENVIMSPHRASIVLDAPDRVLDDMEFNIRALENGIALKNVIDFKNRY